MKISSLKRIAIPACCIFFTTALVTLSSGCYNNDKAHNTTGIHTHSTTRSIDTVAPNPGTVQVLTSLTTTNSVSIMYSHAYDNVTPASQMQYAVYKSSELNIETIPDIEANATLLVDWTSGKANTVVLLDQLAPGTKFHINVIARDAAGNKTAYTMTTVQTATHHSYLYYYNNPGADGQWFTADDIKETAYKVRNWNGIWDLGTFFVSAGTDNIPQTPDDTIIAFSGPYSYSNGVPDKFVYSMNPGNDNIYLTTDDPNKYYYPFNWNQDHTQLLNWHYSYLYYYYYSYEYDANNRPIKEIYYTGKGIVQLFTGNRPDS